MDITTSGSLILRMHQLYEKVYHLDPALFASGMSEFIHCPGLHDLSTAVPFGRKFNDLIEPLLTTRGY